MSERLYRDSNDRSSQNDLAFRDLDPIDKDRYNSTPHYSNADSNLSMEELDKIRKNQRNDCILEKNSLGDRALVEENI